MNLLFKLAVRNLLRQRRRSLLTGLTMAGGYFLIASFIAIAEGSYSVVIGNLTRLQTGHVQIHAAGYFARPKLTLTIADPGGVMAAIRQVRPDVQSTERVLGGALAFTDEKSTGVRLMGVDPGAELRMFDVLRRVRGGEYLKNAAAATAVVGYTVAKVLKLEPGSQLYLVTQAADGSVANDVFEVTGIIGSDEDSFDRLAVYIGIDAARRFLELGKGAHQLVLTGSSWTGADRMVKDLASLSGAHGLELQTWKEAEPDFYHSMTEDKEGNNITYSIISILVALGVLNTVLMSTLERTREFGLLRAVGTRPAFLFSMVVTETLILAVVSILAGLLAAVPLIQWLSRAGIRLSAPMEVGGMVMDRIAGQMTVFGLVFPAVLILSIALIVSLWPAVRAAAIVPVRALHAA